MATFVTTVRFTQQGIQAVGDTTDRAASLRSAAEKMGVTIKDIYWTLGDFDGLLILDAPDDETAAAFLMHAASQGNVQTTTTRAFTAEEMQGVLAKMSS